MRLVDPSLLRVSKGQLPLEGGASLLVSRCLELSVRPLGHCGNTADERQSKHFLVQRGLGIRSATRDRDSAFWASWADALPTIRERHPSVADQRGAAQHIEDQFRTDVMSQLELHEQALFRSQSGPLAGVPFICTSKSPETRFEPQLFRVLLLRRLWCPLPLCVASCRCGRPLDPCGHHRAACPHAGVLGRRGFPLESAAARVCREAGARVSTNVRVQDMDLPPRDADNRRIEVVADGLPLFHGAQLAIDTTLVSHCLGMVQPSASVPELMVQPWSKPDDAKNAPIQSWRLAQVHGRARLVVLACEVGGRWSAESLRFLHLVAEAKVRDEPEEFRDLVNRAWMTRWSSLLACTAARALAFSLLERRCAPGCDGVAPSTSEVGRDHRHAL